MTAARRALGTAGEERAARWYAAHGYRVLDRNWRCRDGEIDLVCWRDRTVVVAEVKTRSSAAFGHPIEAVTETKQQRLRLLAVRWLEAQDPPVRHRGLRFDVVSILGDHLEVIENAF